MFKIYQFHDHQMKYSHRIKKLLVPFYGNYESWISYIFSISMPWYLFIAIPNDQNKKENRFLIFFYKEWWYGFAFQPKGFENLSKQIEMSQCAFFENSYFFILKD